jgi:hypothetical protein
LDKRDLLAYYLLCSFLDKRVWNIGEAIDVLVNRMYLSRRVAYSVFRRLRRLGLLIHRGDLVYECFDFNKYFEELLKNYVCGRRRRRGL